MSGSGDGVLLGAAAGAGGHWLIGGVGIAVKGTAFALGPLGWVIGGALFGFLGSALLQRRRDRERLDLNADW